MQRLSRRRRWDMPAARLRQRRVRQAARGRRLRRGRRGRHLAPARRPHPRPRAVRVRADLRAATPAGARRRPPRHRRAAAARACWRRPAGATRSGACAPPAACARSTSRARSRSRSTTRATPARVGVFEITFQPVPHFLPTQAVSVAGNGHRITYSADSSPSDELCAFARDTDLLLIEATLPRPEREGPRGHLTPEEAGEHGRRAGARRVVLTHISDELDADWARREAERTFGGPVEVAAEGAVYRLVEVEAPAGRFRRFIVSDDRSRGRPLSTACDCCRTVRPCSTRSSTWPRSRSRATSPSTAWWSPGRTGATACKDLLKARLGVRARVPVRAPAERRAGAAAAGRDAARPLAHRLVPRLPLARPDEAALPADRRAGHRPRLRPRGADARQARRDRGPRRRAAGRRRGARRALLLRLPRPHRRAGGGPAAAARGRGAVRQPRPARRTGRRSRRCARPGRSWRA